MSGIKAGDGYWIIENPNDETIQLRYKEALSKALALLEDSIKLTVRARDRIGLLSLKQEVEEMIAKAENTLRNGNENR